MQNRTATARAASLADLETQLRALTERVVALRADEDRPVEPEPPVMTATLGERIEAALRERPATIDEIVFRLRVETKRVKACIEKLRAEGKIYNLGSEERPVWTWIVGDDGETQALIYHIEQLITVRPMLTQEIVEATGARRNRISGALVKLQMRRAHLAAEYQIRNEGDGKIARWFAPKLPPPSPMATTVEPAPKKSKARKPTKPGKTPKKR